MRPNEPWAELSAGRFPGPRSHGLQRQGPSARQFRRLARVEGKCIEWSDLQDVVQLCCKEGMDPHWDVCCPGADLQEDRKGTLWKGCRCGPVGIFVSPHMLGAPQLFTIRSRQPGL